MEGNLYNKIAQEINLKLPDINFDSDSDDVENDKPIKPYIRPAAEILFAWDSNESEELMEILSKMPTDAEVTSKTLTEPLPEEPSKDENSQYMNEKLPFMNISLSNGIRSHVPTEFDNNESRILLPNLELPDNVDLDKVLEDLDLSNCQSSFFDDVLTDINEMDTNDRTKEESVSTLLMRLDEMSKKYDECRQSTNNSNLENCHKHGTGNTLSLSNLFNQLKFESSRDTVVLDLRVQNSLWSSEVREETRRAFRNHIEDIVIKDESSDDDDDEADAEANVCDSKPMTDLWIDSYRKSKLAHQNNKSINGFVTDSSKLPSKALQVSVKATDNSCIVKEDVNVGDTVKDCTVHTDKDNSIPDHVRIKIEKIKEREKILSERRSMGYKLSRFLPVADDCPLLFHEEVSFDPAILTLSPTFEYGSDSDVHYFKAIVLLSAPNCVMTASKVPSPISVGYPNENFAAILSVMVQLTTVRETGLPFVVIGLQMIHYEDQLQICLLCHTSLSLTNLKSELKKYSLREMISIDHDRDHCISDLPLSNMLRILPYNAALDGNIWNWNNGSIIWKKLSDDRSVYEDHGGCKPLEISTSCIVLLENFYMSVDFYQFILRLLERCTVSGVRLIYGSDEKKQLVLAIRGYDGVNTVKIIQNKIQQYRTNVTCTRFQENSLKELVKYFGPRLNDSKLRSMFDENRGRDVAIELSAGLSSYHSLHVASPSDIIVLISPECLDIGWIIHSLLTIGGYRLVTMTRLEVSMSTARQIGVNEHLVDHFQVTGNGPCHLIVLRNEHPLHSIMCALHECSKVVCNNGEEIPDLDRLFYWLPYSRSVLDLLDLHKITQTPSIRELTLTVPEAPFEDCEQCSFVLLISDELTRHVAQLLDQMSNFDLLAAKCMARWPSDDHLALVQSQFGLRLPVLNPDILFEDTEGKMRIGVFVVRSMFLIRELEKIQSTIRLEKNLIFAYTMNVNVTFGMAGSFFTSSELISDARRRSALQFLPEHIISKLATVSVLSQLPLVYAPITSALSIKISNPNSVTTKFRQIWFLLTREGFIVSDVVLSEPNELLFIVTRPNGVFYLIQWAKSHFSDDDTLKVATTQEEISEFQSMVDRKSENIKAIQSITSSGSMDNLVFIMLDELLLNSSPEMLSTTKVFWNFLEENDYHCASLCLRTVIGSDIFRLKDVSLRSLSGNMMKKETRYLCLLITGSIIGTVIEDLLKCKINLLKTDQHLTEEIYLCCDNDQIIQCCNILMGRAVFNNPYVDVCFR